MDFGTKSLAKKPGRVCGIRQNHAQHKHTIGVMLCHGVPSKLLPTSPLVAAALLPVLQTINQLQNDSTLTVLTSSKLLCLQTSKVKHLLTSTRVSQSIVKANLLLCFEMHRSTWVDGIAQV